MLFKSQYSFIHSFIHSFVHLFITPDDGYAGLLVPWSQCINSTELIHPSIHRIMFSFIHSFILLLSGPSCSLGYFPFQPVVHNWFIKARGMYCSVYGKVHIKDPLLLIEKSSLCGDSGFPSKTCVNVTI